MHALLARDVPLRRADEIVAMIRQSPAELGTFPEGRVLAYALRLLGEIVARRDPPESEQAETHYRQALALADELGMRPLLAHCHRGLGTLYATLGRGDTARTALAEAIALYRAMDMTFWVPQTEAVLAQVEGR